MRDDMRMRGRGRSATGRPRPHAPIGGGSTTYVSGDEPYKDIPERQRKYLMDLIRRNLLVINHKESTVAKDGRVTLDIVGTEDSVEGQVTMPFETYKALREVTLGLRVERPAGVRVSKSGGWWKN